ncbi:uncharacterized protein JN550_010810 [Neoarthrinium moseri]|uniref:uncharacterized protein n=1 Tax=Neoarthrinium moseri TaxID=1658444 RepID=UPI001FDD69D0|nr:uncharacterized protein JN550_010810 [Neoarthrinium moseri]KAI1861430.1 hypothetical protein JN550_010810 [Neoarthrinium moseri]
MAASLGILKSLPCPAGKNCTAFQCLFKHDGDDATAPVSSTETPALEKNITAIEERDSPRKRLKLTPNSPVASSTTPEQSGSSSVGSQALPRDKTQGKAEGTAAKASTMKPISPPTVQRKTTASGRAASRLDGASLPGKGKATSSASSQKSPNVAAADKTPKKPETLNPRHLKKAPAKHDMRYQLVKLLHAQYERLNNELKKVAHDDETKLIMSEQELIVKALDDEQEVAIKKPAIYGNVLKNRLSTYRKLSVDQWKMERAAAVKEASSETSPSQEAHKIIETGLSVEQEVDFLHRLSTPLSGLERFGYISTIPKDEDVEKAKKAVEASGNIEVCDRCGRRFTVFPGRRESDGALTSGGSCVHHPGKSYFTYKAPGDPTPSSKKWRCCDQTMGDTEGCVTGNSHVFKTTDPNRLATVLNFAETPLNPDVPEGRAVGFDCEMGYTVYGMELIRLTAVSWPSGEELLDILVYPVGEYIDLNTRYSGVRPEDMAEAERWKPGDDPHPTLLPSEDASQPPRRKLKIVPSPRDARDLLFSLISPDTPLVGHGLENDLNAMRIIHPVIVDTILLFPHKRGLPARNSLKWLMESLLDRKIQIESDDENHIKGHDSAEDARAAGELVRLKVRDEWKNLQMKGWNMGPDGSLQPPDDSWTVVGGKKTKRLGQ